MEQLSKKYHPFWIFITLFIATGISFLPESFAVDKMAGCNCTYVILFGISKLLIMFGLILFSFFLSWQRYQYYLEELKKKARDDEWERKRSEHNQLFEEAKPRRKDDENRNLINDLFRLIESAKETTEKTESAPVKENGDKLLVRVIEKKVTLDTTKLELLIENYNKFSSQHKTN